MNLSLLLLILILSGGAGAAFCGTLLGIFGWIAVIILLVFIWEYKKYIFLVLFTMIAISIIKKIISDYLKYKDETPAEKEDRLKTNKMIKEWQKHNNF